MIHAASDKIGKLADAISHLGRALDDINCGERYSIKIIVDERSLSRISFYAENVCPQIGQITQILGVSILPDYRPEMKRLEQENIKLHNRLLRRMVEFRAMKQREKERR